MSLLEETPLLPESSKGAIKIGQGKGEGLIGCGGIKDFIIALMFVVSVYLCFSWVCMILCEHLWAGKLTARDAR